MKQSLPSRPGTIVSPLVSTADSHSRRRGPGTELADAQLARHAVAVVLASGRGARLRQLSLNNAKPALDFGGKFRIVDFALSNCLNSGIRRMAVLTQYNSHSLIQHVQRAWSFLRGELNEMVDVLPAHQRGGEEDWYRGTADSVYRNLDILLPSAGTPRYVVVMAGDDVYKMDYAILLRDHVAHGRGCTIACAEIPRAEASTYGVMSVHDDLTVASFIEDPVEPPSMPARPDISLVSMGIYVFDASYLVELLESDALDPHSSHDFGRDIIPMTVAQSRAVAHPFHRSCVTRDSLPSAPPYWRRIDTLDAFLAAHLDLAAVIPALDLYDAQWPIWTDQRQLPPAKFVFDLNGQPGLVINSTVSAGCVIVGSQIKDSVIFSAVRVMSFCDILKSVLMPGVQVGAGCRLRRVIVEGNCVLPEGLVVGEDAAADRTRFERTGAGTVLITKAMLTHLAQENVPNAP
ncbi:glucose-1-phosphate adenylyltransferase [Variovorax rhizosphaerae]|uniref:Glucose-1-phosphate adenylyltransferase n=1 Tax=Variovorax rhizosphaerae TaxID=1836200 RepID=A0ABU8WZZ8_9BURK